MQNDITIFDHPKIVNDSKFRATKNGLAKTNRNENKKGMTTDPDQEYNNLVDAATPNEKAKKNSFSYQMKKKLQNSTNPNTIRVDN